MKIQKQYGNIVVNFEFTYPDNEWTIWADINGLRYSSESMKYIIYSIQNLPKQIQFLMDRFDSTLTKINEDEYAITIDYVLYDVKITILMHSPELQQQQHKIENWLLAIHGQMMNTDYIFPLTIKKYSSWGWLYKIDDSRKLLDDAFLDAYKTVKGILVRYSPDNIEIVAEGNCIEFFGLTLSSITKIDIKYLYKINPSLVVCKEPGGEIKIYLGDFEKFSRLNLAMRRRSMNNQIFK